MNKPFNVLKDYDWTSVPRGSALRTKGPSVWVKSYKIKSNQIMQTINTYIQLGGGLIEGGDAKSFYDKLYSGVAKEEDNFFFPFFSDSVRSFGNNFGDTFQSGIGGGGGILGDIMGGLKGLVGGLADFSNISDLESLGSAAALVAKGEFRQAAGAIKVSGNPGTYIETPKFYEFNSTSDAPLEVSFSLSNTMNPDSIDNNYKLIKKLTEINRPTRKNGVSVDPPRIYRVKVPGHRFIRWAYCSQFSVQLEGARRKIDEKIVPESYKISMAFSSLTLEHSGFMSEV